MFRAVTRRMSQYRKYDVNQLVSESKKDPNVITIEATVVTGFEYAAIEECNEKCTPLLICKAQGRIVFNLLSSDFHKVLKLRSVDNLFYVNDSLGSVQLTKNKENDLEVIKSLVDKVNWEDSLSSWSKIVNFEGILFPNKCSQEPKEIETSNSDVQHNEVPISDSFYTKKQEPPSSDIKINEDAPLNPNDSDKEKVESQVGTDGKKPDTKLHPQGRVHRHSASSDDTYYSAEEENTLVQTLSSLISQVEVNEKHGKPENKTSESNVLKFRATCNRVGEHSFSSMEAAACFGGALQDKFNWTVNLNNFDLNVILNINSNNCYICSAITERSLHRRNITHFGYTTLRPTLCYNMVRLAEPTKGEIIVDPLCGGGSIPIEGAIGFPYTFHICGDNNDKAMKRTQANVSHINENQMPLMVDAIQWNVRRLPLKEESVDVCVTDLPFGKRSGKKSDNLPLYKDVLKEIGRVCRCGTARAVLLTHDKKSLTKALSGANNVYWRQIRTINVNQGGLFSTVFLLLRTSKPFEA